MNIAVKKISNNAGFSESTLLWALICSILLHLLLVAVIPNIKFDAVKKPDVLEIQLAKEPEPAPITEPQPEPPKPEPVQPKTPPKPVIKPAPVIVRKEAPAPVTPTPPPVQATPPEVIAAPPKADTPPPAVVVPQPPPKPTVAPVDTSQAREGYGNTLWSAISKFKKYPRIAQSRGWQGDVSVELTLDSDGKLLSKKIVKSSGHDILDQQALEMVDKALPFPEPPEALRGSGFTVRVPIPFKLEQP